MILVFGSSTLSTQNQGERANTGWLGIGIMCQSGSTCLSADSCFSELALKFQLRVTGAGRVQSEHHHRLIEN